MASKFGNIAERLTGAKFWFVPDGTNLGTTLAPVLSSAANKPIETVGEWDDDNWPDYDMGNISIAKYDPVTQEREREFYVPGSGYKKRKDKWVVTDAFNLTMIDYAETLFDRLMFGLASDPVDNTGQQAFATNMRHVDGWGRMIRYNEDNSILCQVELHIRLSIGEHPEDKNDRGSPVWRIEHLADAGTELEDVIFRPTVTP